MFSKKIFGVLLVFSFTLPAAQAEQQNSTSQPTAFLVETAEVNYSARGKNVDASGRLANKSEQKLSFKTSGPVAKILVDEGDRVKKRTAFGSTQPGRDQCTSRSIPIGF